MGSGSKDGPTCSPSLRDTIGRASRRVQAGALQELRRLQGLQPLLPVTEPDLRDAAPQRLVLVLPEGDPGVDEVLPDLRSLAANETACTFSQYCWSSSSAIPGLGAAKMS
ncbi:hypothetical protein DKM19_27140 [Streptosporangium sp. 'caverna']|nr:hypothetical protein DKM19_27140 [Streptosporangium sp. 'caverna']